MWNPLLFVHSNNISHEKRMMAEPLSEKSFMEIKGPHCYPILQKCRRGDLDRIKCMCQPFFATKANIGSPFYFKARSRLCAQSSVPKRSIGEGSLPSSLPLPFCYFFPFFKAVAFRRPECEGRLSSFLLLIIFAEVFRKLVSGRRERIRRRGSQYCASDVNKRSEGVL